MTSYNYITNHINIYYIDNYTLSQRNLKINHNFIIISQNKLL